MKVFVLGTGGWGIALAMLLHQNGHQVSSWTYQQAECDLLHRERCNEKLLPGVVIPEGIEITTDMSGAAKADLVVLAGYLPILGRQVVRAYEHRIINIHPALIPAFCGPGMYGHHVHEAVLAYGAKISGATTHFVDEQIDHGGVNEECDGGPIILQKAVPVEEGDTPETLAARVLTVEHEILPESVRLFCAEKLGVDGRQVHVL